MRQVTSLLDAHANHVTVIGSPPDHYPVKVGGFPMSFGAALKAGLYRKVEEHIYLATDRGPDAVQGITAPPGPPGNDPRAASPIDASTIAPESSPKAQQDVLIAALKRAAKIASDSQKSLQATARELNRELDNAQLRRAQENADKAAAQVAAAADTAAINEAVRRAATEVAGCGNPSSSSWALRTTLGDPTGAAPGKPGVDGKEPTTQEQLLNDIARNLQALLDHDKDGK